MSTVNAKTGRIIKGLQKIKTKPTNVKETRNAVHFNYRGTKCVWTVDKEFEEIILTYLLH